MSEITVPSGSSLVVRDEMTKKGIAWYHKFTYSGDMIWGKILEPESRYIITNWQTRCEVEGRSDGGFDIKETFGADLIQGEEYLIIKPSF